MPVVGADIDAPIVLDGGKPTSLSRAAGIMLTLGDAYAPGFVKVANLYQSDVPISNDAQSAAQMSVHNSSTQVMVEADLTPDTALHEAYALLIASPTGANPDDPPQLAAVVRSIGDMTPGTTKHFSSRLPKLGQSSDSAWTLLVFTEALQVRSSNMHDLLPGYFDRLETLALKKRIAARADKGADAPIAVFRQMPMRFPEALKFRYHGTTVKVDVRVNMEGRVVWAKPLEVNDPELTEALLKGFGNWMFLPPMKEGSLTIGKVIVPIKL